MPKLYQQLKDELTHLLTEINLYNYRIISHFITLRQREWKMYQLRKYHRMLNLFSPVIILLNIGTLEDKVPDQDDITVQQITSDFSWHV